MVLSCTGAAGNLTPFRIVEFYLGQGYQLAIGGGAGSFVANVDLLVVPV
jgi:hypothetical protein